MRVPSMRNTGFMLSDSESVRNLSAFRTLNAIGGNNHFFFLGELVGLWLPIVSSSVGFSLPRFSDPDLPAPIFPPETPSPEALPFLSRFTPSFDLACFVDIVNTSQLTK